MILADLEDLSQQTSPAPSLEKAFHFLRQPSLANLPTGRVTIDGDRLYAIVDAYTTHNLGEMPELECHKKYIDIQFMLEGQEIIGWASAKIVPITRLYDESKDVWIGKFPAHRLTLLRLSTGQAAVLYPSDAHIPQIADGESAPVKKVVIKVALS